MSGRFSAVIIRTSYANLPRLERFVDGFSRFSAERRARAKLVACELFDNLVAHGRGVAPPAAFVSLSSDRRPTLTFRFRASNLEAFLVALEEARADAGSGAGTDQVGGGKRRFDEAAGLYRGFGLRMCVRLSSSIEVRRGLFWHRLSVVFS